MKKNVFLLIWFIFPLFFQCTEPGRFDRDFQKRLAFIRTQYRDSLEGKVIYVSDGDTFHLLTGNSLNIKIRLVEIDAPERHQAFGKKSRAYLSGLIYGRNVKVFYNQTDRYGRILGMVFTDTIAVNDAMVRAGMAWQYKRYSNDAVLEEAEAEARKMRRGLWKDKHPVPPWEWRRIQRNSATTAPSL
jgi:endonuclease YncB( thermonuclease family)